MDISTIANALSISIASQEQLTHNQSVLNESKKKPQYAPFLLTIACDIEKKWSSDISLNAAIQLKNFLNVSWGHSTIDSNDRDFIRNSILDSMVHALKNKNLKLLKQFNQCLKTILSTDFTIEVLKNAYVAKISYFFHTKELNEIYIGILALHQLSKIYELEIVKEKVKEFNDVYDLFNGQLLNFLDNCVDFDHSFQNMLMYKILKIFQKVLRFIIPNSIQNDFQSYEHWQRIITRIILLTMTDAQYHNAIIFKLKKISFDIILRLYQKVMCCVKKLSPLSNFVAYLQKNQLRNIFELYKNSYVKALTNPNQVYDKCFNYIYKMFFEMIGNKQFVKEIIELFHQREAKERLIKDSVISDADINFWYTNPKNYVTSQMTILSMIQNKRFITSDFIIVLMSYEETKEKPGLLFNDLASMLIDLLQRNEAEKDKEAEKMKNYSDEYDLVKNNSVYHHKIKEAILFIIEKIKDKIFTYAKDTIERLIRDYIVKEFDSKVGFLRERACCLIEHYKRHTYKDITLSEQIICKLCFLLEHDQQLPVKVMAALALPCMITKDNIKGLFTENLKQIIMIYLKLIEEIELMQLITSINTILKKLKNDMKDYIISFCEFFAQYFVKEAKKEKELSPEAMETTEISTILDNVLQMYLNIIRHFDIEKEQFNQIIMIILNILRYCLTPEGNEQIEEGLTIIIAIMEKNEVVIPELWSLYSSVLLSAFESSETDYECYEDNITAICYYIAKDTKTFVESPNGYIKMTLEFLAKAEELFKEDPEKLRYTYQIFNIMFESCRDYPSQIDLVLVSVINYITMKFPTAYGYHQSNLGELLSSCIIYKPDYCLNIFESNDHLLKSYLNTFNKIASQGEVKRYIFALCSIAIIPKENQKQIILKNMSEIFKTIVRFGMINLSRGNDEEEDENDYDEFNDDDDNVDDDMNLINQCINNEKFNVMNLAKAMARDANNNADTNTTPNQFDMIFNKGNKDNDNNNNDDDDIGDDDFDNDDYLYQELRCINKLTALGKERECVIIKKTMVAMKNNYLNDFDALIKTVDNTQLSQLNSLLEKNVKP